jgi:alpha-glucoside transport system substrate-binding protein
VSGGPPVSRRTVLRGLGLAGLGAAAGCGTGDDTARVAVVWSGAELRAFRRAVDAAFPRGSGLRVSVVSLGDYAQTLLKGGLAPAVAPDVAILPQPTQIGDGRGLVDLDAAFRPGLPAPYRPGSLWATLAADQGGRRRGVWYKATHKSLVWYRKDVFDRLGLAAPKDWPAWVGTCAELAAKGQVAPLALGAADGWVVTDWFENVLLGRYPDLLDRWATQGWRAEFAGEVGDALRDLSELWSLDGAFPGGTDRALQLQFGDSVLDVMDRGQAAMVAGADFAYTVARSVVPDDHLGWFPFPRPPSAVDRPVLVGGDLAVLLTRAGDAGREVMQWLAEPRAAQGWAAEGGFVSLHGTVAGYPEAYRGPVAGIPGQVRAGSGTTYDLSDRLSGPLAGGDGTRGLSWVLQRFLGDLGRRSSTGAAVTSALRRLRETAGPAR